MVYLMLNKPSGVISATVDEVHETVLDCIGASLPKDCFPVGRLDIDTEGLLLITMMENFPISCCHQNTM